MLTPGAMFGDYRVVMRLGKGGMGEVWLLEIEARHQLFAVKILDPGLVAKDREYRKRFVREAEIAMVIRHPNLVRVYDVGEDPESGLCYILMQYVGGGSLSDRIQREGRLSVDVALDVVAQLADVLEVARIDGVVHRDLKPDNVLFDANGVPMLTDLGIARRQFERDCKMLTMSGIILGTPSYMAPEQMLDSHEVDCRADIYSLGIVLYEMLTGERPNAEETTMQLLRRAAKGEQIPDIRLVLPELSEPVAELVRRMCEADVDRRLATPRAVAEAVEAIRAGRDPFAPASTVRTQSRRRRRWRLVLTVMAVAALVLIAVDFVAWWRLLREVPAENEEPQEDELFYIPSEV